jgi:hypothetical protein
MKVKNYSLQIVNIFNWKSLMCFPKRQDAFKIIFNRILVPSSVRFITLDHKKIKKGSADQHSPSDFFNPSFLVLHLY